MALTPTSRRLQFEQCEPRLYLAVTASIGSKGYLQIAGNSTGPIEIVALDADSFEVTEAGAVVGNIDGVTGGIQISLGASSDEVVLDLANSTIKKDVRADLGDGDNKFTVLGGTILGNLAIEGGSGADTVIVESNLTALKNTTLKLGDGDNVATLSGNFAGNLTVETGAGLDTVTVGSEANVAKSAKLRLGGGNNLFNFEGDVARDLYYDALGGSDSVNIFANAHIGRNTKLTLGSGYNVLSLGGRIDGSVRATGGWGIDIFDILASARIAKSTELRLANGHNVTTFGGEVASSLLVENGVGYDRVVFAHSAKVNSGASIKLGDGNDELTFDGLVGGVLTVDGAGGITDTLIDHGGSAKSKRVKGVEVNKGGPVNEEQVLSTNTALTVAEGATGTISSARLTTTDVDNTAAQLTYTVTSGPSNGALLRSGVATTTFTQADINAGLVTYQHDGSQTTSDSFAFTVNDGQGASTSGTFSIVVTPVNNEQVLSTNTALTVAEGATGTISSARLTTTDVDNTAAQLTYTVTSGPSNGTLLRSGSATTTFTQADINAGLVTYQHDGSQTTSDSFAFTVNDGQGASTSGTFSIVVTPVNDEQVLSTNTALTVAEGATGTISSARLTTTDVDNTAAQLTYTVTSGPSNGALMRSGVATTTFTQADINAGLVTYQHDGSQTTSDSFAFTVNDGQGASTSGTFSIVVTPVNEEQVLSTNTALTVAEGATGTISSARLTTTDVDNTAAQLTYTVTSGPSNGALLRSGVATTTFTQADINAGLVTYQHDGSQTTSDSFAFTVNDGQGASTSGTFSIVVTPANDEQVLSTNTALTVAEGATGTISSARLTTTDVDNTAAQLTYTVTSGPSNGALMRSGVATTTFTQADINAGLVTYQHDGSQTTSDSFAFTVNDGQGASTSGTFSIVVTPANNEQVLSTNTALTVAEGATGTISSARLTTTDVDNTAAQLTYTVTSGPSNGALLRSGVATTTFTQADINAGLITYQHNGSQTTSDSFAFTVNDGQGASTSGTFSIVVTPVNEEQVLSTNTALTVAEGATGTISSARLTTTDVDNTAAQLTYTVTSGPSNGALLRSGVATTTFTQADINAGLVTYQHDGSQTTSDSFAFTVNDGQGASTSGTFEVIVTVTTSIPAFDDWLQDMLAFGQQHGAWLVAHQNDAVIDGALARTYYDAARVFYQIADFTGDASWNAYAEAAVKVYRDRYVVPNNGAVPGYWNFTRGLVMHFERTGDTASRDAVITLSNNAAYLSDLTPASHTENFAKSREVAYGIMAYLDAERVGAPRRDRLELFVEQALGHLEQWFVNQADAEYAPYMFGLTADALIQYYEQVDEDPRIIEMLELGATWTWNNAWVAEDQSFWYRAIEQTNGAPDLNLLIVPVYEWLHQKTGNSQFREQADQIFAGGVQGAWLSGAKQFNQNYRVSFDYISMRQ